MHVVGICPEELRIGGTGGGFGMVVEGGDITTCGKCCGFGGADIAFSSGFCVFKGGFFALVFFFSEAHFSGAFIAALRGPRGSSAPAGSSIGFCFFDFGMMMLDSNGRVRGYGDIFDIYSVSLARFFHDLRSKAVLIRKELNYFRTENLESRLDSKNQAVILRSNTSSCLLPKRV